MRLRTQNIAARVVGNSRFRREDTGSAAGQGRGRTWRRQSCHSPAKGSVGDRGEHAFRNTAYMAREALPATLLAPTSWRVLVAQCSTDKWYVSPKALTNWPVKCRWHFPHTRCWLGLRPPDLDRSLLPGSRMASCDGRERSWEGRAWSCGRNDSADWPPGGAAGTVAEVEFGCRAACAVPSRPSAMPGGAGWGVNALNAVGAGAIGVGLWLACMSSGRGGGNGDGGLKGRWEWQRACGVISLGRVRVTRRCQLRSEGRALKFGSQGSFTNRNTNTLPTLPRYSSSSIT